MSSDDLGHNASTRLSAVDLRFREGSIRGTLQSNSGAPIPRHVMIWLDGVEVGTAAIRGEDPSKGPFTWFAPARLYDDKSHTIHVVVPDEPSGAVSIVGTIGRKLQLRDRPLLRGGALCRSSGHIQGYAWNSVQPAGTLLIELWERGVIRRTLKSNLATPQFAPPDAPDACGFSFVLDDLHGWVSGTSKIIVPKLGEVIRIDFSEAISDVVIESIDAEDDLIIILNRPAILSRCAVYVEIDGKQHSADVRAFNDFVRIVIQRPLFEDSGEHKVAIELRCDGETLASCVGGFRWAPPSGLLKNADFSAWSGDKPLDWSTGAGVVARPGVEGGGIDAPSTSIAIEVVQPAQADGLFLSQQVALNEGCVDGLEVELISRCREGHLVIDVRDTAGLLSQTVLDSGCGWNARREFLCFNRQSDGPLTVSLSTQGSELTRLHVGYFNLGPKGFLRHKPADRAAALSTSPIANGQFRDWSRGLEFAPSAASQETADGWTLFAQRGLAGIRAGLEQVKASDCGDTYGLAISGVVSAGPVRMATQIDPHAMKRRGNWQVGVTLQKRARAGATAQPISRLDRVIVTSDPASLTAPAATIGYNIHVGVEPERHAFLLKEEAWTNVGVSAKHSASNLPPLFLVFEFNNQAVDCVFTNVLMEPVLEPSEETRNYSSFEDYNLLSQIERVHGLNRWRSAAVTDVAPVMMATAATRPADTIPWQHSAYPLVDIVIPVYNAEAHTLACLAALVQVTDIPYRLIIVDDGSAPATAHALDEFAVGRPWVQVIHNSENRGYTITANTGLKAGRSPWIVLLNSDTIVTPGWLQGLMKVGALDEAIAMVGPLSNAATWQSVPDIRDRHGQWAVNQVPPGYTLWDWAELVREKSQHAYPDAPLLNGFCTLMRRSALAEVGFLDEEAFPIGYGEEIDLCLRVSKAGYRMVIADDVYVFHHKSSSFGKERRATLAKQGGAAVRKKHRDVDLAILEQDLMTLVPVVHVRQQLKDLQRGAA